MVKGAVRRLEPWLEEDAAIGYRLQRGRPFIRKTEANEELEGEREMLRTRHETI